MRVCVYMYIDYYGVNRQNKILDMGKEPCCESCCVIIVFVCGCLCGWAGVFVEQSNQRGLFLDWAVYICCSKWAVCICCSNWDIYICCL